VVSGGRVDRRGNWSAMVAGEETEVIGLQRPGGQLLRFAKLAAPLIANHRSAPPAPTPAARKCAAFRNAAAPHRR
jgi:hypothetical protein